MESLKRILIAVLTVLIFIWLIPVFAWLFVILLVIGIGIYILGRYRIRKMMDEDNPYYQSQDAYEREQEDASGSRIDPDVIDVEYTEREEE